MMTNKLAKALLLLACFCCLPVTNLWADTKNVGLFIRITPETPSEYQKPVSWYGYFDAKRPYIEFQYPDYDFNNNDDAMVDIKISLVLTDKREIVLATMPRCHDDMVRQNTSYGVLQIIGSNTGGVLDFNGNVCSNKDLRRVVVRYYPTAKSIEETEYLKFSGTWDYDDDGGHADHVEQALTFENNSKLSSRTTVSFNGAKLVSDVNLINVGDIGDSELRTRITDNAQFANSTIYGDEKVTHRSGHQSYEMHEGKRKPLSTPYSPNGYESYYTHLYTRRSVTVPNGCYGNHHDETVTIVQEIPEIVDNDEDKLSKMQFYIRPDIDNRYRNSEGQVVFEMRPQEGHDFLFYRRLLGQPESARTYIGRATTKFVDTSSDKNQNYVYDIHTYDNKWTKKTYLSELAISTPMAKKLGYKGKGNADEPYEIWNFEDLNNIKLAMISWQYPDKKAVWQLKRDIDFGSVKTDWEPIGNQQEPFRGVFDGNGHTINVNINTNKDYYAGLFGNLNSSAMVQNLNVTGNITTSAIGAASIATKANRCQIECCQSSANIISTKKGRADIGGIAGIAESSYPEIRNCIFKGLVSAPDASRVGGIIAGFQDDNEPWIYGCLNLGSFNVYANNLEIISEAIYRAGNNFYLPSIFGKNSTPATMLTEEHKGTKLSNIFGIYMYSYAYNDYPTLKQFNPEGTPDILLSPSYAYEIDKNYGKITLGLNRHFEKGMRYILMLPMSISAEQAATLGEFYTFKEYNTFDHVVTFTKVEGDIQGNTAYVFQPSSTVDHITVGKNTLLSCKEVPDASVAPAQEGLYATYQKVIVPKGAFGYSAGDASDIKAGTFVCAGDNVKLPVFSGYLWLTGSNARTLKALFVDEFGDVTGIETLNRDEQQQGVYLLNGQQVNAPRHGVNIINGKKVYIK